MIESILIACIYKNKHIYIYMYIQQIGLIQRILLSGFPTNAYKFQMKSKRDKQFLYIIRFFLGLI